MGILEVLCLIFIVLKLTGVIAWSWFYVLLPEILALGLYLFALIIRVVIMAAIGAAGLSQVGRRG